jgi:tRNA(Ile)-lysidine synthase
MDGADQSGDERRGDPIGPVRREVAAAAQRLGLRGGVVLVAASGGVDSTVLADALAATARLGGFRVALGHVHHGLRGAESDADEASVRDLAGRLGVPCACERVEPQGLRTGRSSRDRPTLQEAARSLRYAALERQAGRVGASHVATAHHADDQAETVLLRLFRGAGPDALGGIPERSPEGRIVRPLLRVSRAAIEAYARARGLAWREDASNVSDAYSRNRLRREFLPALSEAFNPRLLRAIADLAEAQRRDSEWIAAAVARESRTRFSSEGAWLRIDTKDWTSLPAALTRRLVRVALRWAGLARHVERVHLERVQRFLANPSRGRRIELPKGFTLDGEPGRARLGRRPPGSPAEGETVC